MTTATNWLLNWAIAYATPYLVQSGAGNGMLIRFLDLCRFYSKTNSSDQQIIFGYSAD